jgi:DNA-binding transcriptional regulator of glucitol operon
LHLTLLVTVVACLALGWWQLERAISGNNLSWVYTFEWPFFASYGIYMWWKLVHEEPGVKVRFAPKRRRPAPTSSPKEEEELAKYNEYLAELNASDRSTGA